MLRFPIWRRWNSTTTVIHQNLPALGPNSGISRVKNSTDRVYVAMSGGVDSSTVAAILANKFGRDRTHGVFMNNWSSESRCQESSWRDVQRVCKQLGIPCHRIDLERDYWSDVFEPMLDAYQRGDTPNPDVSCNRYIKFGHLIEHLKQYDPQFKWIATGHYAGVQPLQAEPAETKAEDVDSIPKALVKRASYMRKDQSYYLATVRPETLNHILFPLAHMDKPSVRKLAAQFGLDEVADKPDSQGLCFVEQQQEVGHRGFRKFLSDYLVERPGPIVLASNPDAVVGTHRGLWTHTVGQRASVSMPQHLPESRGQWFVVAKDKVKNSLLIDRGTNSPLLFSDRVSCERFTWHKEPSHGSVLYAQYRSLQTPWKLKAYKNSGEGTLFEFDDLRRAVAPGQYLVVYEDDAVIGAGTISDTNRSNESVQCGPVGNLISE